MIRINLLPVKQIKSLLRARNEVVFLALSLLVLACGIGVVALAQQHEISNLESSVRDLTAERDKYQATITLIDRLKVDKANLETKLTAIKQLKRGSQLPVRVLNEIADLTPSDRVWLNQMTLSGNRLQLSGVALDNATIADFMNRLGASAYFTPPELASSSQSTVDGQKLKSFSLSFQVVDPSSVEAPAAAGQGKG